MDYSWRDELANTIAAMNSRLIMPKAAIASEPEEDFSVMGDTAARTNSEMNE